MKDLLKKIFPFFYFPLLYIVVDVLVRFKLLALYKPKALLFYALSILFSIFCYIFFIKLIKGIKRIWLRNSALFLFSIYMVFTILSSYIFYYFNGFFPNYYTFQYFRNEPYSAYLLFKDTVHFQDVLYFTLFLILFYAYHLWIIKRFTEKFTKRSFGSISLASLALYLVLYAKVLKYDQCYIVGTNFSLDIHKHLLDTEDGQTFKGRGLGFRIPSSFPVVQNEKPFNVLVFVFESLRHKNMSVYDYARNTTPNLKNFISENNENTFVFQNTFTVSTTTMLAVPAILTGIGPYQEKEVLYKQPMLWDFARYYKAKTFFLSSHSMKWYHFDRFYAKEPFDHFWYAEKTKHPYFNDLGVDDKFTIEHLNETIEKYSKAPFFGAVQMNATHYPYHVPKSFEKWNRSFADQYDNSIHYQDALMKSTLDLLKKKGLLKNTVIIFTSDHGESLKDHNLIGHVGTYYQETIHVPLIFYIPPMLQSQLNMRQFKVNQTNISSTIDIAPSLMEIFALNEVPYFKQMQQNYSGYNLFKPIPKERTVYTLNNNGLVNFNIGVSILKYPYHYLYRTNIAPVREEIYDLKKDILETKNLANTQRERIKQLIDEAKQFPELTKQLKKHRD
jgi:hypothetical protein